ncbi:type II toxin-antitoxin system RelE/ParE family toxin [Planotetraspora sp. A-T 1434]|uniref:type II toxin-antitoxin system RelE/ParE family toxin n=1 Tax=Planotetraspora sp. A-T 1434 TaxID=2979219 RepID=UPI0021C14578|nr:type II toxin-antitoxin system RelE/ParE family toxin [Planotetraspora sp. A-T 1434]MCT9933486.1 type II toxin-antitoxin system RelE/ParE family toxin [Planotetraspora sp. A-T 1434]
MRELYRFEVEPEVREWFDTVSDSDFKRVDEVAGLLAEKGTELGGPWSDHLEGPVWELRVRLRDVAARVTYWCTPSRTIVLLTVFRKTKQHDQRQIDRRFGRRRFASVTIVDRRPRSLKGWCDGWLPHPLGTPWRGGR